MESFLSLLKSKRTFILYGIIGLSAVVVDVSVFVIFHNFFDVAPVLSTVISVAVATVYAFSLNALYNFRTKDLIRSRFASYTLASLMGMLASALIIKILGELNIDANVAKIVSLPPIVILQYLFNKTVTFKKTPNGTLVKVATPRPFKKRSIAIIGAGFTGLSAAYGLAKKGYSVTVYEAEATLGGLVSGFSMDGLPLEKAYHFLYKTDSSIINLANEIGVGDSLKFYSSSVSIAHGGKVYPFMTPLDLLRFKPLSLVGRIRAGLVAVYLGKQKKWKKYAQVPALSWMKKYAGEEVTRVIWEPVLRGKFFNYYDKIAMSYVWSRIFVRINSKDKGDVTEKLGYFAGSFQTFTNKLAEECMKRGVVFHTNTKPTQLIERDGKSVVVVDDVENTFDAVLSTVPSHVFRRLIEHKEHSVSTEYLDRLTAIDYLGAVLMVFTTSEKFTDYYWHNINDTNQPFLVLLSLSSLVGTETVQGKHVYYVGAYVPHDHKYYSMTEDEIRDLWVSALAKIFPKFNPDTITNNKIFRFRNAQHIVEPGYEEKIVPYQSELPHLYLSNFTQIFPEDRGTNFAVAEGIKVADIIDANLQSE